MARSKAQLDLFPDLPQARPQPTPGPLERAFMSEIMHAARSMGLIAVHIETFCPRCRMQFNRHLAGLPDVLFISAGLEIKRNDSYEPSPGQQRVIERLEHAGVPCAVVSPGSEAAALEFLKSIAGRP